MARPQLDINVFPVGKRGRRSDRDMAVGIEKSGKDGFPLAIDGQVGLNPLGWPGGTGKGQDLRSLDYQAKLRIKITAIDHIDKAAVS